MKPGKPIDAEATAVHGITNQMAEEHSPISVQWSRILAWLNNKIIVIHNASYDWLVIETCAQKYGLEMPNIEGVFCSQKSATAWAVAMGVTSSARGPSLDKLTQYLGVTDLRAGQGDIHGALIDALQTAEVVRKLVRMAH